MSEPTSSGLTDRLVGKAKSAAGAVLGRDDLKREGALHEQKADLAAEAKRLEADAERDQAQAALVAREREVAVERDRLATEAAAEASEQQVERERAAEQARVATEAERQR